MSVEFSNAYQEILLDNLMSIIKQNFIFQTQLKLAESSGKQKEEIQAKYNELVSQFEGLQQQVKEVEALRQRATSNDSAHQEKSRIQSALNDEMKKNITLKKEIEALNSVINAKESEIAELKNYASKLEEIAPISKLKKINPDKKNDDEVSIEVKTLFDVQKTGDGSTF
jgi:chromosome segregation ATPase